MAGPSRRPRAQLGHSRRGLAQCVWREGCRHLISCIVRDLCLEAERQADVDDVDEADDVVGELEA